MSQIPQRRLRQKPITARLQSLLGVSLPEASRGRPGKIDSLWKLLIVLLFTAAVAIPLYLGLSPIVLHFDRIVAVPGLRLVLVLSAILLFGHTALTFLFSLLYRPVLGPAGAALPRVTVIVPAFNEGPMVGVSIGSILLGDYPRDRLEILAIDDGSTDDTWAHIERVAHSHPAIVRAIRMPQNGGKKEALCEGFRQATGALVVTVDSVSSAA